MEGETMILTEIIPATKREGKKSPLLIEIPLPSELDGPFLVTSSKSLLWVENKFATGVVRAAVRKVPLEFLWRDMLKAVRERSQNSEWGSVLPCTKDGLSSAITYLAEFDLKDVEILSGSNAPEFLSEETGLSVRESSWVPEGWVVLVPQNKAYLGTSLDFGDGQWAVVLHNASRAVAILVPDTLSANEEVAD